MTRDKNPGTIGDGSDNEMITEDLLFNGRLVCRQHAAGYRFSIDSILLAHFAKIRRNERVLDLGTGCGVIGLILGYLNRDRQVTITGIELQPELVNLARDNIATNDLTNEFTVRQGNIYEIKNLTEPESFSLVILNPPFYAKGTGRVSGDKEAMTARHQDDQGLDGFIKAAAYCVKNRGKVVIVYPAEQTAELLVCLENYRISPKEIQFVYSYPESCQASLVVLEGIKNGGRGLKVCTPCYVYQFRNGPYSQEVEAMFRHPVDG